MRLFVLESLRRGPAEIGGVVGDDDATAVERASEQTTIGLMEEALLFGDGDDIVAPRTERVCDDLRDLFVQQQAHALPLDQVLALPKETLLALRVFIAPTDLYVDLLAELGVVGQSAFDVDEFETQELSSRSHGLASLERLDDICDAQARTLRENGSATSDARHEDDPGMTTHTQSFFDQLLRKRASWKIRADGFVRQARDGRAVESEGEGFAGHVPSVAPRSAA